MAYIRWVRGHAHEGTRTITASSWGFTLGGGVEYDVRFTPVDAHEMFWTVTLGITEYERDVRTIPGRPRELPF
ncbi:MAG: hypothetical protein IPK60_05425 [Sandaracinaceae bacterium]|nr:hypothetical protein [Sandaracinaceae bacterium]